MNKKILWIAVFALSLIFGQSAFADHNGGFGEHIKKLVESLKLDPSQQAKIKTIKDQTKDKLKDTWEKMKALRQQTQEIVQADTLDESKLDNLVNQKKELIGTLIKAKITAKHQIYELLTPEQKTKFQELMKQWEEKRASSEEHE
jgi:periplasmic protein CpxP/Spy